MAEMTPELWRRIAGVMEVTLELERPLRQVYLASIQAQEPAVADNVRSLLISLNEIDAADPDATEPSGQSRKDDADRIGPYRILSVLGQGGMGTVFLAEQREESLQRKVAIKLIHDRYAVAAARQRFLAERQILAHLEHSNIARMYDAGTTPDGRPYLVIEAIEGLPLDQYCDENELSIPGRLRLLREVCHAVSYAHSHLVVHRDIKPSNILVTADGEPKLLDFGIAKILDRDVFGLDSEELTRTSEQPMTPSYASPEQIQGLPITTATDIFALGALLYKLLTGKTPFRYPARTPEVMQAVQASPLAAPSQAVLDDTETAPAAIADHTAVLKGDLDNIVLKALAREGDEGYRSAQELSEDLTRYLDGLPVLATRGSTFYKARKFVRRNRWPVTLAALLLISLVTGLMVTSRQAEEIRQQRDQVFAEKEKVEFEKERSDEVNQFLIEIFENASPDNKTSQDATVRELLDRAVESIDNSFNRQPLTKARLRHVIGDIYFVGLAGSEARVLLTQALEERRQLLPEGHEEIVSNLISLARPLIHTSRYDEAEAVLDEAFSFREGTRSKDEVDILIHKAELSIRKSRLIETQRLATAALEIAETAEGIPLATQAAAASSLMLAFYQQGQTQSALVPAAKALAISRQLFGEVHPETSAHLANLGTMKANLGQYQEAKELLTEALEIDRQLMGDSITVTITMMNLGLMHRELGELDEAIAMLEEVVANFKRLNNNPRASNVARALSTLAAVHFDAEEFEKARDLTAEAIEIYDEKNKMALRLVRPLQLFARILDNLGEHQQAIAAFDRSIGIIMALPEEERSLVSRRRNLALSWLGSANIERRAGRFDLARNRLEKAAEFSRQSSEDDWNTNLANYRTQSLLFLDRPDEAMPLIERLVAEGFRSNEYRIFCRERAFDHHCDRVKPLLESPDPQDADSP